MTIGSTIDFYDYSADRITALLRSGMILQHDTRYTLYYLPGTGPVYDEVGTSYTGRSLDSTLRATCDRSQHFPCTITRIPSLYRRTPCV